MKSIQIKAPAKINIGLNIVRKRDDGYHDLETFFYPIYDMFDELFFERSDRFLFQCENSEIFGDNLVIQAKDILEKETGKELNVGITLKKNIPIGAGLGGGSSDAAAALISLNEMFALNIDHEKLSRLALQLGSDVPFFIKAKPAIGKSRGEKLTVTDFEIPHFILFVNPGIHISTKEAYSNISPVESNINYNEVFKDFKSFFEHKEEVRNDFEAHIFKKHPEIKLLKDLMIDKGAYFSQMSGSGSTVYGLFKNKSVAESVIDVLPSQFLAFISSPE